MPGSELGGDRLQMGGRLGAIIWKARKSKGKIRTQARFNKIKGTENTNNEMRKEKMKLASKEKSGSRQPGDTRNPLALGKGRKRTDFTA